MRVGVLGEYSGTVRDSFIKKGHDAVSFDLLPTESPGPHIQGDCFDADLSGFDLLICHPPCTYLCNSGVSWLHRKKGRWEKMIDGAVFFRRMLDLDCPKIAVENPDNAQVCSEDNRTETRLFSAAVAVWSRGD